MCKGNVEKKFIAYRENLFQEARKLTEYIYIYHCLHERRFDRLDELNMAPAFFQTVIDVLLSTIIICTDKLFDLKSERGFVNFLKFIENNSKIFVISELKKRIRYPDADWVLNLEPITSETTQKDIEKIKQIKSLPSFSLRRDKIQAHLDKDYFFNRSKLSEDAPLTWGDLNQIIKVMDDIINRYSLSYDGKELVLMASNINDINHLLDVLHKFRNMDTNI